MAFRITAAATICYDSSPASSEALTLKIGIFLSAAVVILFVMLLLLNRGEPATRPTSDSGSAMLALQAVPDNAPSLHTPANPDANGDEAYHRALSFFTEHEKVLGAVNVHDELAEQWGALFVEAAKAGRVSEGFLDKSSSMTPVARGPYSAALQEAPRVVLSRAQTLFDQGHKQRAIEMGRAMWALGLRGYTKNNRANERFLSLWCMEMAHDALRDWLGEDGDEAKALKFWGSHIQTMNRSFKHKYELLMRQGPNIGDVIRIANEDQDPTFRMEATLKLGVLQFAPKNKANLKLMQQTFERNRKDANPLVAKAAAEAQAMTVDQIRRMR
jgi:hypothetical protein